MDKLFEGATLKLSDLTAQDEPLVPGDIYLAERNTGPHLLTCSRMSADMFYVIPREMAYCYNSWECHKVLSIE